MKKIKLISFTLFLLIGCYSYGNGIIPNNHLSFTKNKGQLTDMSHKVRNDIKYYSQSGAVDLYVSQNSILYIFKEIVNGKEEFDTNSPFKIDTTIQVNYHPLNMKLINSNPNPEIFSMGASVNTYNYFYTHCPDGISNVHSYDTILIKGIYPNIDWLIYTNQTNNGFKHEFIVHPKGNPSDIKIEYEGAESLTTNGNELTIKTKHGVISDKDLYCYQNNQKIASRYRLNKANSYSFELGDYNQSKDLVIDPLLVWSTYYGSSGTEFSTSITTDINGFIYAVGYVQSTPVPTMDPGSGAYYDGTFGGGVGLYDMIIVKFDANYNMIWATYYGGTDGDYAQSVYTDSNGNVFITGWTHLSNMPTFDPGGGAYFQTATGGGWDVAILKFSPTGVRLWATTFGLTGTDYGYAIQADAQDNVYITGRTKAGVPLLDPGNGAYSQPLYGGGTWDAFIAKFANNGTLLWSTNFGGGATVMGSGLDVNANGVINICGMSTGASMPLLNPGGGSYFQNVFGGGSTDAYISSFDSTGVLLYSTLIGGSGDEYTDNDNGLTHKSNSSTEYIFATVSANLFTQNAGGYFNATQQNVGGVNGYIFEFDAAFNSTWASYFGGAIHPSAIATNNSDDLFIVGYNFNTNFDTLNPGGGSYYVGTPQGGGDNFLISFDATYNQTWGTFYGGSGNASIANICTDNSNGVYTVAQTNSVDYPLLNGGGYFQSTGVGSYSFNISKFVTACPTLSSIGAITSATTTFCAIDSNNLFSVTPYTGAVNYVWTTPTGATFNGNSDTSDISINFANNSGNVCVYATDGCNTSDTACVTITTLPPVSISLTLNDSVCINNQTTITASNNINYSYNWNTGSTTNTTNLTITQDTVISLTVTDSIGCFNDTSFTIYANPLPNIVLSAISDSLCIGSSTQITAIGIGTILWNTGGTTSNITVSPINSSWYNAIITNSNGCINSDSIFITTLPLPTATISGNITICSGENVVLNASGGNSYLWLPANSTGSSFTYIPTSSGEVITLIANNGSCYDTTQTTITINTLPTINATSDTNTITIGELTTLNGTGGINYTWTPSTGLSCTNCTSPIATPSETTTYIVTGIDSNGCSNTSSITIIVNDIVCEDFFIPNVFSPNNDGTNDLLFVYGNCIESFEFAIYNRWGNKVFSTTDITMGWDGKYKGQDQPQDVFMYYFEGFNLKKETIQQKGNITLIR